VNKQRLLKVLLGPHVSEKTNGVHDKHQQITFKVARDATKLEVKSAVELLFDVKVTEVTTIVTKGKVKRFGQKTGRRQDWKKAYVSLAAGSDINFAGAE
jgi:large subunit ribosomal protein L23